MGDIPHVTTNFGYDTEEYIKSPEAFLALLEPNVSNALQQKIDEHQLKFPRHGIVKILTFNSVEDMPFTSTYSKLALFGISFLLDTKIGEYYFRPENDYTPYELSILKEKFVRVVVSGYERDLYGKVTKKTFTIYRCIA